MGSLCNKTVGTGTPTDNQILKFDSATDEWGVENEAGGGGSNVKSGRETAITEGSTKTVTFTTAFSATPHVCVSFDDGSTQQSICQVESVSTIGFTIRVIKIGGGGNVNRDVNWIATDAGNP